MKVLVVGGGGREHALVWRLSRDPLRPQILVAPGNAGTARLARNVPVDASDIAALTDLALREQPDLVIVGPEAPLCAGLADELRALHIPVFGPGRDGARIEGSKAFCKEILGAAGVPTARAQTFVRSDDAIAWIRRHGAPLVVKADGLAAGKGVTVCDTVEEAERAVCEALDRRVFGEAGEMVLVEERLVGEEVSVLALVDGERIVLLPSAQDHKRLADGDRGPNTGGMGAYSPAPVVADPEAAGLRTCIFEPVVRELRRRGIDYRGVLYAGLMITRDGPKVLEFNCRFGAPETQAILPRWEGPFLQPLLDCALGRLDPAPIRWRPDACVCVVLAAGGYPGTYRKGDPIEGIAEAERLPGVIVFHAGTALRDGRPVTAGGRVLGVTALGTDIREAVQRAYDAVACIRFPDAHYRRDIAARALARPAT
ncbi:MAG: phosphoribosylamine--glycine ligase [Kiritimatiellae bacterium]|nr:phosphoribosylamine--glycine ligase [Kiritimatiellia bacterium]